jgi:hypothetical protein
MNTDADLEKAIQEAVEARNARYRLTFEASVQDGKYHKLQVLCTRAGAHIAGRAGTSPWHADGSHASASSGKPQLRL